MFVLHLCLYKYRSGVLFTPGSSVAYCDGLVTLGLLYSFLSKFQSGRTNSPSPLPPAPPSKLQINQHNTKRDLEWCRAAGSSPYNKLVFREMNKTSVAINNAIYINSNKT